MKIISIFFVFIILSACATSVPLETVHIPAPHQGWKVGYAKDRPGQGNIVEYVRKGENIENWSELITIQFFENSTDTPTDLMSKLKTSMNNRCQSTFWKEIEEDEASILYEWKINNCKTNPDQHEIARIFKGNDGLHRAAYTIKTSNIENKKKEDWIKHLKMSYVTKYGKKIVINSK